MAQSLDLKRLLATGRQFTESGRTQAGEAGCVRPALPPSDLSLLRDLQGVIGLDSEVVVSN